MDQATTAIEQRGAPLPMREFIALIASLMAMVALGIDTMLPALPQIGDALGVAVANDQQYVITFFGIGFGVAQLAHGPLVDRYGRRRTLIVSLLFYSIANALAAISGSFTLLLAARFFGGASVAATRVATVAMVRDCFAGRAMARIMSLAFMIFMAVPIMAPAIGAVILLFADWRTIFWLIAGASLLLIGWVAARMPETQRPEDRSRIELSRIVADWRMILLDRYSIGYSVAAAGLSGALYGYLGSIEQITARTFGQPRLLLIIFATSAATMAGANFMNSALVMRLGTRRLSQAALVVMIASTLLHLTIASLGGETIIVFAVLQAITLGCFGLASSNFSAMAMERMGHVAGTASSVQGFIVITFGAALGALVGHAYDGSTIPLTASFLAAALLALGIAFTVERGRLFHPG